MSSIHINSTRLTQRHREFEEELGYIEYDKRTGKFVLWLKDSRDLFNRRHGYVRGDEYDTMRTAKAYAAGSASARLMHLIWLSKLDPEGLAEVQQEVAHAHMG